MKHSAQMLEKMSYVKDGGDRMDIPEELLIRRTLQIRIAA